MLACPIRWAPETTQLLDHYLRLELLHGLRSAEVMALNRDDLLLSEGQLRVRGKGNKLRFLPLEEFKNRSQPG